MNRTSAGNACGIFGSILLLIGFTLWHQPLIGLVIVVVVWIARYAQLHSNGDEDGYADGIVEYQQPHDEQEREPVEQEAEPFRIRW